MAERLGWREGAVVEKEELRPGNEPGLKVDEGALSPGGVTAAEAGRDGLMGWDGNSDWKCAVADWQRALEGTPGEQSQTVHGSESIPAIRVIIWLREWEVNGVGHHSGSGVGW
jgi:hypothetical protein